MNKMPVDNMTRSPYGVPRASKTVPRTYMSAAGIQSEISAKTLASVAHHQDSYDSKVECMRSRLQARIREIHRDEASLHKSIAEYSQRLQEEREQFRKDAVQKKVRRSNSALRRVQLLKNASSKKVQFFSPEDEDTLNRESPRSTDSDNKLTSPPSNKAIHSISPVEHLEARRTSPRPKSTKRSRKQSRQDTSMSLRDTGHVFKSKVTEEEDEPTRSLVVGAAPKSLRLPPLQTAFGAQSIRAQTEMERKKSKIHNKPYGDDRSFLALVRLKQRSSLHTHLDEVDGIIHNGRSLNDNEQQGTMTDIAEVVEEENANCSDRRTTFGVSGQALEGAVVPMATRKESLSITLPSITDDVTSLGDPLVVGTAKMVVNCKTDRPYDQRIILPSIVPSQTQPRQSKPAVRPKQKSKSQGGRMRCVSEKLAPRRKSTPLRGNGESRSRSHFSPKHSPVKEAFIEEDQSPVYRMTSSPATAVCQYSATDSRSAEKRSSLPHKHLGDNNPMSGSELLRKLSRDREKMPREKTSKAHMHWVKIMAKIRECHHLSVFPDSQ